MFGKLSLDAIPLHEPIIMSTLSAWSCVGGALLGAITYFGRNVNYLLEQSGSPRVDHKNIGVMYIDRRRWSCCCAALPTPS